MTNLIKSAVLFVGLTATLSNAAQGQSNYTYTTFDFPGAGSNGTVATGINDAGDVVGYYYDSYVYPHGFLWANGSMNTVDFPQSKFMTSLFGINNCGTIVGQIFDNNGATTLQSFVLAGGKYTLVNYPGSVSTQALGINDHGMLAGTYQIGEGDHGFLWYQGQFTTISGFEQHNAYVSGLNDLGDVVGYYYEGPRSDRNTVGFAHIKKTNELLTLSFPGALNTAATAINNLAQIVGYYRVSNKSNEGAFLYYYGVYMAIGPFADGAAAWGINDAGVIAGELWQPYGGTLGFLATPVGNAPPTSSGAAACGPQ
jgi:probable HAF family extracellular repeat protein